MKCTYCDGDAVAEVRNGPAVFVVCRDHELRYANFEVSELE